MVGKANKEHKEMWENFSLVRPALITLGVQSRLLFNPNEAFLLVQKLAIGSKGFTLGVKAEIRKKKFNLPQVTNKLILNFLDLYWPQG